MAGHGGWLIPACVCFTQLARLKEQLLADEGSDMAYPLESLAASHPQKRGGLGSGFVSCLPSMATRLRLPQVTLLPDLAWLLMGPASIWPCSAPPIIVWTVFGEKQEISRAP